MTCKQIRRKLPGYLDGALSAAERAPLGGHLEQCPDCRRELERYRRLSSLVARAERPAPPADLALRIRIVVSRARNRPGWGRRVWDRSLLVFENVLEPFAVPATGGTLTSLLVFGLTLQSLLAGVPLGAVPNDLPTNLMQPARLESLAPFTVRAEGANGPAVHQLVVEATLDEKGKMVDYQIVVGPDNRAVRRQLDQILMFSRFRPQMSFGRPIPGGRVVLSFSEIRVSG